MVRDEPNVTVPAGDAKKGAKIFKSKCAQCHTVDAGGASKSGPNLNKLFGKMSGTHMGYSYFFLSNHKHFSTALVYFSTGDRDQLSLYSHDRYSEANKNAEIVWSDKHLDQFLLNPKGYMPGTKMVFAGLKKEKERADCIAWMKEATA